MKSHIAGREQIGALQRNYRHAWQNLMREADVLQCAAEADCNSEAAGVARVRVEAAAKNYRIARNELAQALLSDVPKQQAVQEDQAELYEACCAGR